MSDKLDFLDGEQPEPEITAEAETPEVVTPEPEKGEPTAAPPAAVIEEKSSAIPISALLDERERRQKAEREAEELRQWRKQIEAQQSAKPAPDFYADPDQRLAYERQTFDQQLWNERLNMSEMLTRDKHGDEAVNAARDAFMQEVQRNPALYAEMKASTNPYGYVVGWHKRHSVLNEIGNDPDAWRTSQQEAIKAQLREELRAELLAEMQGTTPPKPRLPGSLASAPAAGKAGEPRARGSAFDAAFGG